MSGKPMVYLIHNMLTSEECDELIRMANGKYDRVDDTNGVSNYLENTITSEKRGEATAINIDRVTLWKGGIAGKLIKDIDERMSQVTGFPAEHFSDFQVNRFKSGSSHNPHFDINPANGIMASITIFLNDIPDDQGGELVYPSPGDGAGPVIVRPRKGLAVVHHNTDEKYNFDQTTLHQELPFKGDSLAVKYVAKKFVYLNPQPQTVRIMLPLIALPFGGKLPRHFITLQNTLIEKYGLEAGDIYFQKIVSMIPFGLLLLIGSLVSSAVQKGMKKDEGKNPESSDQKGIKQKKTKSKKKD